MIHLHSKDKQIITRIILSNIQSCHVVNLVTYVKIVSNPGCTIDILLVSEMKVRVSKLYLILKFSLSQKCSQ